VRRPVRIVFNLRNSPGDAFFVTLEINDAIEALVTTAASPHGDTPVIVATRDPLLRLKQRLLGNCARG
jgi:hypothetical protein